MLEFNINKIQDLITELTFGFCRLEFEVHIDSHFYETRTQIEF